MLPRKHKTLRLKGYDYSLPGYYFVTIKTAGHKNFFGKVSGQNDVTKSWMGKIAEEIWQRNDQVYTQLQNDLFRIMPNHMHALVLLKYRPGFPDAGIHLSNVIRSFKSCVTKEVRMLTGMPNLEIWQRNYYDRIVHSEKALDNIRKYILYNQLKHQLEQKGNS